jgi:hypothetical protein
VLPSPGCDDILPTRSSVSEEASRFEGDPGAARVPGCDVRASMGRCGDRMDMARDCGIL